MAGSNIHYEARPFEYIKPPVKDKPIAGCYRVHIPVENYHSIQCVLELEKESVDVRVWLAADPTVYFKTEIHYGTEIYVKEKR